MADFVNMGGGSGGGVYPYGTMSFTIVGRGTQATLTWRDPDDSAWQGTKILRKVGAWPEDENDGVQVVDSKVKNQYSGNGFVDAGLIAGQTYYYQAFPYSDDGANVDDENRVKHIAGYHAWGVRWKYENPSPKLERIGDAVGMSNPFPAKPGNSKAFSPFDSCFPWAAIRPVNIVNGAVTAAYGDASFSFSAIDVMVEIPKFWCKYTYDATSKTKEYWIADGPIDASFAPHPAFERGDKSRDAVYVSRYEHVYDQSFSTHCSKTGLSPTVMFNHTRGDYRSGAKNKNTGGVTGWSLWDYAALSAIQLLFIVEFATWDSQSVMRGYVDSTENIFLDSGSTDAVGYHTGCADGTDGRVGMHYRWIENLWGNTYTCVDGINVKPNIELWVCLQPSKFSDGTTDYTKLSYANGSMSFPSTFGFDSDNPWVQIGTGDRVAPRHICAIIIGRCQPRARY